MNIYKFDEYPPEFIVYDIIEESPIALSSFEVFKRTDLSSDQFCKALKQLEQSGKIGRIKQTVYSAQSTITRTAFYAIGGRHDDYSKT